MRPQIGCLPYFYTWRGPSANLECRSEMCCTRLAANTGAKKVLAALLHGSQVVGVSQTAALNRGRHLYSAGRLSRSALAHISSWSSYMRFSVRPTAAYRCTQLHMGGGVA